MRLAKPLLTAVLLLGGSAAALRAVGSTDAPTPAAEPAQAPAPPGAAQDAPPPAVQPPSAAQPPAAQPSPLLGPRAEPALGPAPRATASLAPGGKARTVAVTAAPGGLTIDATEVTVGQYKACLDRGACKQEDVTIIPDSPCNYGDPARVDHPMNCVSWTGADAYCRSQGERLCTEDEWFSACRGPSVRDYPYGTEYVAGNCKAKPREGVNVSEEHTEKVGASPACEGGYPGLFDMAGNVAEWVDSCTGDYCHFYGGAFLENDPAGEFASCKRMCAGNQKSFRSSTVGFRCCKGGK